MVNTCLRADIISVEESLKTNASLEQPEHDSFNADDLSLNSFDEFFKEEEQNDDETKQHVLNDENGVDGNSILLYSHIEINFAEHFEKSN